MNENRNNPHNSPISYRPDVDGLRALAVIAVFVFHAFPSAMHGGFVGVDVFFVISGFLISSIILTRLDGGTFSFSGFYSRRIRRIYPALITVLVACFLVGCYFLVTLPFNSSVLFITGHDLEQIGRHIAGGAGFVSNIVLWTESGYFDELSVFKPLLHLWSLGIEEQFYIVWPFVLWFCFKRRWNLFIVCAVLSAASFAFNLYEYRIDRTADFYSPLTRFWELALGAMLAWLAVRRETLAAGSFFGKLAAWMLPGHSAKRAQVFSSIGCILLLASVFLIRNTSGRGFPGAWALVPVSAALLVLAAGEHGWFNRYVLSNRLLVWLGLISYPLYLWHWPLLSFAHLVTGKKTLAAWYPALVFPVCVLLAWATTKFIENPLRFGRAGNRKTAFLFAAMVFAGLAAFFGSKWVAGINAGSPLGKVAGTIARGNDNDWQADFDAATTAKYMTDPYLPRHPTKPTLAVVGDSHAAHLLTGMNTHLSDKWHIWMRVSLGCPMIPDDTRKDRCKNMYGNVMPVLLTYKPEKVVLAGNYSLPSYKDSWLRLKETIDTLRAHGINDIVIMGQAPNHGFYPAREVIVAHRKGGNPDAPLPKRVRGDYSREIAHVKAIREKAKEWGVPYLSPFDVLCDKDSCLALASDDPGSIISFDFNHLSSHGSNYVMSKLKDDPALQPPRK